MYHYRTSPASYTSKVSLLILSPPNPLTSRNTARRRGHFRRPLTYLLFADSHPYGQFRFAAELTPVCQPRRSALAFSIECSSAIVINYVVSSCANRFVVIGYCRKRSNRRTSLLLLYITYIELSTYVRVANT